MLERNIATGLATTFQTLHLSSGLHQIRVTYEQYGGDYYLNVRWAPTGETPRPFNLEQVFPEAPLPANILVNRVLAALRQLVRLLWIVPPAIPVFLIGLPRLFRLARHTVPS